MNQRFSEALKASCAATWQRAIDHRFVRELCAGTISDAAMADYLIQDHRFIDSFLRLLGAAIAAADTFSARLRFARFAGLIAGEENTYFLRAFAALGVSEVQRDAVADAGPTARFKAIMEEAADTRSYGAILAVLCVAEGLYLDWATRAPRPLPENFIYAEWIVLHDNPGFRDIVNFLRGELDRVGPAQADICRDFFSRSTALELAFFDGVYEADK